MELTHRIEELLAPAADEMGLEIVRVHFGGEGRARALQIMAERQDGEPLSLADCSDLSKTASTLLDVEDWIEGQYNLEVSSPGMERPLIKAQDFERFTDRMAKVELDTPVNGRKRFKGTLKGMDKDRNIILITEDSNEEVLLPYQDVYKARLVVTHGMIEEAKRKAKKNKSK